MKVLEIGMNSPSMISYEYIKKAIESCQVTRALDDLASEISTEDDRERRSLLLLNSAIAKMSLQSLRGCIKDCEKSTSFDALTSAYFIKGLAYLWLGNEKEAVSSWKNGLERGGHVYYFAIMSRLVIDPNARSFFFSRRYNVVEILDFIENFDKKRVFTNYDTQVAYAELRKNALSSAITNFNLILANDPDNMEAIRGRGTAECFSGQWKRAIDDFTIAIQKKNNIDVCSKFRAVSYAAIGNYTAAIADFSTAIALGPVDFVPIAERGRLHMLRKCYSLALEDFKKIPKTNYDDKMLVNVAECYYSIGNLKKAEKAISKVKEPDHRKEYCHYLVCRDLGKDEDALIHLKKAIEFFPSFFLNRVAGDFLYELGRFHESIPYYIEALTLKVEDAETQRMYALSLFQSGFENQAMKIFVSFEKGYNLYENEIDLSQDSVCGYSISGHLKNFYQTRPSQPILKRSSDDYYYLVYLIKNSTNSMMKIPRWNLKKEIESLKTFEIPKDFHFRPIKLSEEEIQMCNDADRFGKKVFPNSLEVSNNPRLIRCFGFCVLYLSYLLTTRCFKTDTNFREIINNLIPILQIADLSKDVRWTLEGTTVNSDIAPCYHIQQGEKLSPRYKFVLKDAINQLNANIYNDPADIIFVETIDDIYSLIQKDVSISPQWKSGNQKLLGPSINLKYLGTHGYDLYIRPPLDPINIAKYEERLHELWNTVNKLHGTQIFSSLTSLIMLLWNYHPLTFYSNELGHIFIHAFILATYNCEATKLAGKNNEDLFIKFMINQNNIEFEKEMTSIFHGGKLERECNQASIDYWGKDITIEHLLSLLA